MRPSCHLGAVESGHHNVGEQQINLGMVAQQEECSYAIDCLQNGIAALPEDVTRIAEDAGVVIYDRDVLRAESVPTPAQPRGFEGAAAPHAKKSSRS